MPPRQPTVLFHLGAVPTASRLVQRCMRRNSDVWRAHRTAGLPDGVLANCVGRGDKLVADPYVFASTLRETFADQSIDLVAGARDLLGPAFGGPPEAGLHPAADDAILALAEATRSFRQVVILSVCPQSQLVEMHHEKALSPGHTGDNAEWLTSVDLGNLSWLPLHGKLAAAFGRDAVVVHDFRRTHQGHAAFLRAVFAAAGLELPDAVAEAIPRPKLRFSETGLRLATAARPHLRTAKEREDLNTFLERHFSELDGPPTAALSVDQDHALQEQYGDELSHLLGTATIVDEDGVR